jgi:hypothetical protein
MPVGDFLASIHPGLRGYVTRDNLAKTYRAMKRSTDAEEAGFKLGYDTQSLSCVVSHGHSASSLKVRQSVRRIGNPLPE